MQRFIAITIAVTLVAIIYMVEKYKPVTPVGLNPLFQVLGDVLRQAEKLPLMITRISDDEEDAIGNKMATRFRIGAEKIPEKLIIEAYLKGVGNRLAIKCKRKGISYQFYLVKGANAFALPGGHIAVGLDLLKLMKSEDELAAVIGHEMAHVDRRHCIERLQYELAAHKMGLDIAYILASIPVTLFQTGYSKNQELDADRIGLQYAVAGEYSPQGVIDLFQRIRDKYEVNSVQKRSPTGEIRDILTDVPMAYFRSHPPFHVRMAGIEQEIRLQGWKRTPVQSLKPLPTSTN